MPRFHSFPPIIGSFLREGTIPGCEGRGELLFLFHFEGSSARTINFWDIYCLCRYCSRKAPECDAGCPPLRPNLSTTSSLLPFVVVVKKRTRNFRGTCNATCETFMGSFLQSFLHLLQDSKEDGMAYSLNRAPAADLETDKLQTRLVSGTSRAKTFSTSSWVVLIASV